MAVQAQAQYVAHAFLHDSRAIRPELDRASVLLGGHLSTAAARQAVGRNTVFGDITCNDDNNNIDGCFVPRKRARVGDVAGAGLIMEGHGALLPPLPAQQAFGPPAADVQGCRALCSGATTTSGRVGPVSSRGLLSILYRHGVEIDALVRIENERLRAGLVAAAAAQRRHVRAVVAATQLAAARRLRGAEAELERALVRNAELEEKLRQTRAEGQAWQGIARSHEAVAAGLCATLDQLLQSPDAGALAEGDAEDAQSCCFEQVDDGAGEVRARACKLCGVADACVLLLPCRHLCLCPGCEAAVDACPVCSATKNASLHILLS